MTIDLAKNEVRVSWRYPYPQSQVFGAIAAGRLLMTCGGRMHEFKHEFRVGGAYQYAWAPGKTCRGTYLEIVPESRAKWTWDDWIDGKPSGAEPSEVTATVTTKGAYTVVEIVHLRSPSAERAHDYHQGWTEVLGLFLDELDGTTIRLSHDYEAAPSKVFSALAAGGLFRFTVPGEAEFKQGAIDFKVGGKFHYPCGADDYVRGEIVKIVPDEELRFTWSTIDSGIKVEGTDVLVFLEALATGGTRLHLVHDGLTPAKVSRNHIEGWRDALAQFASLAR